MSIRDWPDEERPREKLLRRGAAALSDAELLAIFLRIGIPGRSAVDLARDMLKQHESLRKLLELDQAGFCATPGPVSYTHLDVYKRQVYRYECSR